MNIGDQIFVNLGDEDPYPAVVTAIDGDTVHATVFTSTAVQYYAGPVATTAAAAEKAQTESGHPQRAYAHPGRRKTADKPAETGTTPED